GLAMVRTWRAVVAAILIATAGCCGTSRPLFSRLRSEPCPSCAGAPIAAAAPVTEGPSITEGTAIGGPAGAIVLPTPGDPFAPAPGAPVAPVPGTVFPPAATPPLNPPVGPPPPGV